MHAGYAAAHAARAWPVAFLRLKLLQVETSLEYSDRRAVSACILRLLSKDDPLMIARYE